MPEPCDEHDKRISSIGALVEQNMVEVAIVKTLLQQLQKSLYGNGNPGDISRINSKLAVHDKWMYVATGILLVYQFLSASGIFSLKALIAK